MLQSMFTSTRLSTSMSDVDWSRPCLDGKNIVLVLKECPPRPHWAGGPEYYGREVYLMWKWWARVRFKDLFVHWVEAYIMFVYLPGTNRQRRGRQPQTMDDKKSHRSRIRSGRGAEILWTWSLLIDVMLMSAVEVQGFVYAWMGTMGRRIVGSMHACCLFVHFFASGTTVTHSRNQPPTKGKTTKKYGWWEKKP